MDRNGNQEIADSFMSAMAAFSSAILMEQSECGVIDVECWTPERDGGGER